jgi:hypothetical protein
MQLQLAVPGAQLGAKQKPFTQLAPSMLHVVPPRHTQPLSPVAQTMVSQIPPWHSRFSPLPLLPQRPSTQPQPCVPGVQAVGWVEPASFIDGAPHELTTTTAATPKDRATT